jgi:hypothetical protein
MFDIENFPTNETAKDMLSMVSPIYNDAYVGKWIYQIMGLAMQLASDTAKGTLEEGFPQTATYSLPWWEDMYGLPVNPDLPIDERRRRIVLRRTTKRPMNPAMIEKIVREASGRDCHLEENTDVFTYEIWIFHGESEVVYDVVRDEVDKVRQEKNVIIVFETPIGIKIRADPEWRLLYPYPMTSETLMAGTYPERANKGKVTNVPVDLKGEGHRQAYPYVMSGVMPDPANIGQVGRMTVDMDTESGRQLYPYLMTSEDAKTGSNPEPASAGKVTHSGVSMAAEAGRHPYPYTMAGVTPEPANAGEAEAPGVSTAVTEERYSAAYKMCGLKGL